MKIAKFLITGAVGISVNLGVFHTLFVLGIPYLAGSVAALLVSMIVGFVLQKYWTFEDSAPEHMHRQFALYAALALCNLAINTAIVYALIDGFAVHYLFAQAIGAAIVAVDSFFAYHFFIFKSRQMVAERLNYEYTRRDCPAALLRGHSGLEWADERTRHEKPQQIAPLVPPGLSGKVSPGRVHA